MSIRELLVLRFEITTPGGQPLSALNPPVLKDEIYEEAQSVHFEIPDDLSYHEIPTGLIDDVTMALLVFPGEFTVRLNGDVNLVIPCEDVWLYRSSTPLTKLEVRNDASASDYLRGFLLGT